MKKINNIFKKEVNQKITARLSIKDFVPNITVLDGSYSVYEFTGKSSVNKPYEFNITFVSSSEIDITSLNEKDIVLNIEDEYSILEKKIICGRIYESSENSLVTNNKFMYKIKVVAPLQYLSHNNRYRIFHEKKVSEIIQEIINSYQAVLNTRIEVNIDQAQNPIKHYVTQYNESDLDFINRLCEEEGICIVYDYTNKEEYKVTLCELNQQAIKIKSTINAAYNESKKFVTPNSIFSYYDENKPSKELKKESGLDLSSSVKDSSFTTHIKTDVKHYIQKDNLDMHKDGLYSDLRRYAQINAQRNYVKAFKFKGTSSELVINDSININLKDNAASKEARMIILNVKYQGYFPNALDEVTQDDNIDKQQYSVKFTAIPTDIIFRPQIKTAKPKVSSALTAIVSQGTSKPQDNVNEIDVDYEGKIRVNFHFEENDLSSCYLRLSDFYTGDGYGSQFLPRVNTEVVVDFVNGDLNKPIITQALHNGENKNPYTLPQGKTRSHIKTHSMPQHETQEGYNEFYMEDKNSHEILGLRAQKDFTLLSLHNSYIDIFHDQIENIKNNYVLNVDHDNFTTIRNDQSLEVQNDRAIHVHGIQVNRIDKNKTIKIGNSQDEKVGVNDTLKVKASYSKAVGKENSLISNVNINNATATFQMKTSSKMEFNSSGSTMTLAGGLTLSGATSFKGGLAIISGAPGSMAALSLEATNGDLFCYSCMINQMME